MGIPCWSVSTSQTPSHERRCETTGATSAAALRTLRRPPLLDESLSSELDSPSC